jgi:carboxylesterase type B
VFFGADPAKVTLVGQSAGGESVLIHLTSPTNAVASMFHAVVSESGPLPMNFKFRNFFLALFGLFVWFVRYPDEAHTLGRSFSVVLGCDVDDCSCFQSKNTSQVLLASDKVINVPLSVSDAIQQWAPVIDGESMVQEPVAAFEKVCKRNLIVFCFLFLLF